MAAVTVCSDFGAQENKICHYFHCLPIYLPWSYGTGCHDIRFWMLSFKPAFSLSSFAFIKRLFSSFSLSAMGVVSAALMVFPLSTWWEELTHWKRQLMLGRLKAGGAGDDRGWDGWMASLTGWTWVWASSGKWWWTGGPWGHKEWDMTGWLNWTFPVSGSLPMSWLFVSGGQSIGASVSIISRNIQGWFSLELINLISL